MVLVLLWDGFPYLDSAPDGCPERTLLFYYFHLFYLRTHLPAAVKNAKRLGRTFILAVRISDYTDLYGGIHL